MSNVLNDLADLRRAYDTDRILAKTRDWRDFVTDLNVPVYDLSDTETFSDTLTLAQSFDHTMLWDGFMQMEPFLVYAPTDPKTFYFIQSEREGTEDDSITAVVMARVPGGAWLVIETDPSEAIATQLLDLATNLAMAVTWLHVRQVPIEYVMAGPKDGDYVRANAARTKHGKPPLQPVRYVSLSAVKRIAIPTGEHTGMRGGWKQPLHLRPGGLRRYKEPIRRGKNAGKTEIWIDPYPAGKPKPGQPATPLPPVTIVTK